MLRKVMNFICSNIIIFIVCGGIYYGLEILFRGYSDLSMVICAGIISVCIGLINNIFTFEMVLQIQLLIGGIIATICEGITGLILIAIYGENAVWNYSDLYGTFFWGQCNIFFCLIWIILSFVAILIADIVDYYLFDGERPYYKINKSKIWFMLPKK